MAMASAVASATKAAPLLRVSELCARGGDANEQYGEEPRCSSPLYLCNLTLIEEQKYTQSHLCCNGGERQDVGKVYIESS